MNWVQRFSVVPAGHVFLAQSLAAGLAGSAGAGMWVPQYTKAGVTYHVSSGRMEDQFADLLPLDAIMTSLDGVVTLARVAPGQPDAIYAACQAAGYPVTYQQITDLLAAVVVVDTEEPLASLASLGMAAITQALP